MSRLSIQPGSIQVFGPQDQLRFSTDKQFPVVLYKGRFVGVSGSAWFELPVNNGYLGYTTSYQKNYTQVLARLGTDYHTRPDFVTGNVLISDSYGQRRGTVNGSYLINFWWMAVPGTGIWHSSYQIGADAVTDLAAIIHLDLYIDDDGHIRMDEKFRNAFYLSAETRSDGLAHAGIGFLTQEQIRSTLALDRVAGEWEYYRYYYQIKSLDYVVGKFIG